MKTVRISSVALLALSCSALSSLAAQTDDGRSNAIAQRRAESIRVGDYCSLAEEIVAVPTVVQRLSDAAAARAHVRTICDPDYEGFSLLQLTAGAPAPMSAVARLGTREFVEGARRITLAMSNFRAIVGQPNVQDVVATALSPQRYSAWTTTSEAWEWTADAAALNGGLGRLSKYERKFGPTSPRLNGAEVVVNYLAQWVPGFRSSALGGPSHWELVASYAPAYVTRFEEKITPISAAEFGFRRYLFGEGFGKTGIKGVFRPSYWSVGVLTASNLNGALIYPWRARERSGGFISWGSVKVGYIKRDRGSWMVSKQFQAIPFV
ncbi:MAG TPA: hypothetical protein VIP11_16010, partial [Gemmatimonadaceae bacterium]